MKLFQYWDKPVPPEEVARWIEGFRIGNPDFEHILYNAESGADFIGRHVGSREKAAFLSVRIPAMQADYLRLCLLIEHGGLWSDVDHQLIEPLSSVVAENPGCLMLDYHDVLNTAFLLFPEPGNVYLQACLDLCTDNIENRRFPSEYTSTGPGVQNAIGALIDPTLLARVTPHLVNDVTRRWNFEGLMDYTRKFIGPPSAELEAAYRAIRIRPTEYINRWMSSDWPDYKYSGENHWLTWEGPIYY